MKPSPKRGDTSTALSAGSTPRLQRTDSGFTLIELLTVLVIIMILVGIIVGASKYAQQKGGNTRAQAEIAAMESALESYKSDNGAYPSSTPAPGNAAIDSILLYNALVAGPKQYMTLKPTEMRANPAIPTLTVLIPITCPANSTSLTYTNVMIVDPFGYPYNYYNPCNAGGANNRMSFDLWSFGPSGVNGAADNITNWKSN